MGVTQMDRGVGQGEPGRGHLLQVRKDPGDLVIGTAERTNHHQLVIGLGQHHPVTSPRPDQGPGCEAHETDSLAYPGPNTERWSPMIRSQSSL